MRDLSHNQMNTRDQKTERIFMNEVEINLLKERNPEYLQKIFLGINPLLIKICGSRGIQKEYVSDLVHQTWDQFFLKIDAFEGRSQLKTFVSGILINKIREHRRSLRRQVSEEDMSQVMDHSFTPEGWWKKSVMSPDLLAEQKQLSQLINDCMQGLTELQLEAFLLKEVSGDEAKDICNVLDIQVSHLRVLIFRAKEKIRLCLEGKMRVEMQK